VNTAKAAAGPFLARMHQRGLTGRAIANLVGCDESTVSRWGDGSRSPGPRLRRLMDSILAGLEAERGDDGL
jgi:hypothetical protein